MVDKKDKSFVMINDLLERVVSELKDKLGSKLRAVILYGSWAKGKAREESDVDILVVLNSIESRISGLLYELERECAEKKNLTIVPATLDDFLREKNPLFTAVKREGKVLWGNVDLTVSDEAPAIKYADYFKKSRVFEAEKVEIAESILKERPDYGSAELCFIAAKHAIQMALAMKGVGYSSKMVVLLPLAEEHFGKAIAMKFKKLFKLYIKSEYGMEFLTVEEAKQAVEIAKEILKACYDESEGV